MILLLMRHGVAEDVTVGDGAADAARALTPKGRDRVIDMANFLQRMGLVPTHLLSSPRVRAVQTAELVRKCCGIRRRVIQTPSLDFEGTWPDFVLAVQALPAMRRGSVVLAAGHEPLCGEYLSQALVPVHTSFPFKKGAVAAVEWKEGIRDREGKFLFYATAKLARLSASNSGREKPRPNSAG